MMNKVLSRRLSSNITLRKPPPAYAIATIPSSNPRMYRYFSATSSDGGDSELEELMDYLNNLKNFEKSGVPKGAGTDSEEGFDLGRMKRLMGLLGNPQSNFKVPFLSPFPLLFAWALLSSFLSSFYDRTPICSCRNKKNCAPKSITSLSNTTSFSILCLIQSFSFSENP